MSSMPKTPLVSLQSRLKRTDSGASGFAAYFPF
ncbi:hypothetical protein SAMN05216227_105310 [Pseudorhodobacter antarcticus]|uniref:Uncharacterized protein n=1 Tax=Pseudorhodobacter antarcticus TaxID=1077947 RepID=A0A1H8MCH3_9RHOB|nr:hypothetical protein SAMN05216227_105310 [Pseudorhodobacter antarcticus]